MTEGTPALESQLTETIKIIVMENRRVFLINSETTPSRALPLGMYTGSCQEELSFQVRYFLYGGKATDFN